MKVSQNIITGIELITVNN